MDEQPDREPREGGPFGPDNFKPRANLQRASLVLWGIVAVLAVLLAVLLVQRV